MPAQDGPLLLEYHQADNVISANVSTEMIDNHQNLLEDQPVADVEDEPKLFDLPVQNEFYPKSEGRFTTEKIYQRGD